MTNFLVDSESSFCLASADRITLLKMAIYRYGYGGYGRGYGGWGRGYGGYGGYPGYGFNR
uniref:Shematrin-like protein 1 n=1 Tax=Haemonchus contortus TaxID=6289 RepID=A0A7I5EDD9_HAECO